MHLTQQQVSDFRRDGCAFPFRVLSTREAKHYRNCLETHEAIAGQPLQGNWRHKTHLLFTWADELVHNENLLDAVSDVLGPDLLCWTTNFFIKEPGSAGFVSWHQDSTYWGQASVKSRERRLLARYSIQSRKETSHDTGFRCDDPGRANVGAERHGGDGGAGDAGT